MLTRTVFAVRLSSVCIISSMALSSPSSFPTQPMLGMYSIVAKRVSGGKKRCVHAAAKKGPIAPMPPSAKSTTSPRAFSA
eukprot:6209166-Pleurochrysis_carterae.AAC.1